MSNTPNKINPIVVNPIVLGCVVSLCLAAIFLIFLLPADSLVIDLIYQGF